MQYLHFCFAIFFGSIDFTQGYRTIPDENGTLSFCQGQQHFILNPKFTCCNYTTLEVGINLLDHWSDCASTEQDSATSAHQASWKVYSCIIQASNGKESAIDLEKFANLMTAKYPTEFKEHIMKRVASAGALSADASSEFDKLDKIRRTYFDIERHVCSNTESKEYGKDHSCEEWEEDLHRGGRCCGATSFPFYIGLKTLMDTDFRGKKKSCKELLIKDVFPPPNPAIYNSSAAMEWTIAEICDLSCELMETKVLEAAKLKDKTLAGIEPGRVSATFVPSWMPTQVKTDAVAYAQSKWLLNNTVYQISNLLFPDFEETETLTRKNKTAKDLKTIDQNISKGLLHIPVACSAHKELLALVEHFFHTKLWHHLTVPKTKQPDSRFVMEIFNSCPQYITHIS